MKRIIVLALFIISSNFLFSQNAGDLTLSELETKLKEAQSSKNKTDEDYYSKAISLRKRIDLAVKSEEYETANKLKLELKNLSKGGNTSERAKLEDDLKKAIDTEDYAKAAEIKKKLNGESTGASKGESYDASVPDVEFVNQVYLWDRNDGSIKLLEYDTPEMKTQVAVGYGYSQSSTYWAIPGIKSDFIISSMENKSFILRTPDGVNPNESFRLVQFKILGKRDPCRHMAAYVTSSGAWVGTHTNEKREGDVSFTYRKLKDNYYEVVLNQGMSAGEYTFYGNSKMFSFSLTGSVNATAKKNQSTNYNSSNGDPNPMSAGRNNSSGNSGNSGGNASTSYTKKDIYSIPSVTFMGLDVSMLTYISYNKVGMDAKYTKDLDVLIKNYNNEMNTNRVRMWFGKKNAIIDKSMANGYSQYLKPNWISNQTQFITVDMIQQHLLNYKTTGQGIGLVVIPEMFNEITKMSNIYFVWFDTDTKAIVHTQQTFARPGGGVTIAGIWDAALIEATKNYVDQYYKKEKRYN